ncbi:MAG: hypothetical protein RLY86_2367 [Pseudomonadota bacterium]|jgi:hypothetical protein
MPTVTLLLTEDDLEAQEILHLAAAAGVDAWKVRRDWGTAGAFQPGTLDDLAPTVILVEMPDPELEERLRASGRRVHVVDHHLYAGSGRAAALDRRHPLSSIEQVAELLASGAGLNKVALDPAQHLVSANDRGFWPLLLEEAMAPRGAVERPWYRCGRTDAWPKVLDDLRTVFGRAPNFNEQIAAAVPVAFAVRYAELVRRLLHRHGLTEDQAGEEVLKQLRLALTWLAAGKGLARLSDGRHGTDPQALTLVLAPDCLKDVLGDALYLRHLYDGGGGVDDQGKVPPLRFLALFQGAEGETTPGTGSQQGLGGLDFSGKPPRLSSLFLSGGAGDVRLMEDLVVHLQHVGATSELGRLSITAGGSGTTAFFGAAVGGTGSHKAVSDLANLILDNVLGLNRPVWGWTTRMFVPVSYKWKEGVGEHMIAAMEAGTSVEFFSPGAQERAYLLPHLREFLAPEGPPTEAWSQDALGIRSYRLMVPTDAPPTLRITWRKGKRALAAVLREIIVHVCYNATLVMEWAFGGNNPALDGDGPLWWGLLKSGDSPGGGAGEAVHTYADLLDFNWAARNLYAPYESDVVTYDATLTWPGETPSPLSFPYKIPCEPESPGGWFHRLAAKALQPMGLAPADVKLLLDERARVTTGVAFPGRRPELPGGYEADMNLFRRLMDVTDAGSSAPYAPHFHEVADEDLIYRRFESMGTLYGVDHHAVAGRFYGKFGRDNLLPHMDTVYRRLWLVAQFYYAVFHHFSKQIARIAADRVALDVEQARFEAAPYKCPRREAELRKRRRTLQNDAHDLRVRFLGFANALWFDQISSQMQGIDLFARMTRQLGVAVQYTEVRDELDRTDELEAAEQRDATEDAHRRVGEVAGIAGGTAVLVAGLDATGVFGTVNAVSDGLLVLAAVLLAIPLTAAGVAAARGIRFDDALADIWRNIRGLVSAAWCSGSFLLALLLLAVVIGLLIVGGPDAS